MAIAEDRRRLATRLGWLRGAVLLVFGLLAGVFWFLQVVQHARFQEMAENNHQRTLALRAPRGVIYDRTGQVLVENRSAFNISIVREHTKDLDRTMRLLARFTGIDEAQVRDTVERHKREPSYRPIVVVQDATLDAGGGGHGPTPRLRTAGRRRPGGADAAVPEPGSGGAPDRIRRRGQRSAGGRRWPLVGRPSSASPASSASTTAADGRGRRPPRGRQQRRPRDPRARGGQADRRPAGAALDQLRDAARGRGRVPRLRLLGRGRGARSAQRRRAHADQPAGLRSQRFLDRHRSRDVGVAQHRQAAPAAEPRDPGPLLAGLDVQDRRGDGRARRGPGHGRPQGVLSRAARSSTAATSSAI